MIVSYVTVVPVFEITGTQFGHEILTWMVEN